MTREDHERVLTMTRDQLPAFKVYVKGVQIGELVGADQAQLIVSRLLRDQAMQPDPSCRDLAARL